MDLTLFKRRSEYAWEIQARDGMRVPAVIYASVAGRARKVARLEPLVCIKEPGGSVRLDGFDFVGPVL